MNRTIFLSKQVLIIGICALLFSCAQTAQDQQLNSEIKAGVATLSGTFIDYKNGGDEPQSISLSVLLPITDYWAEVEASVNEDGSFSLEIPVEYSVGIGSVYSEVYNLLAIVTLMPDKETKIEVAYDETARSKFKITSDRELFSEDYHYPDSLWRKMHWLHPEIKYKDLTRDDVNRFIADPKEYTSSALEYNLRPRLDIAEKDTIISETERNFLTNGIKYAFIGELFYFPQVIDELYQITGSLEKLDTTSITVAQPDRSYYTFLKEFDLNNPQYMYCEDYSSPFRFILQDKTLNIPPLNDMPIDEWLAEVKTILADLVGFDSGLFYDMLAINYFNRQFDKELKPLSEKQVSNIRNYFKKGDIAKILLARNEYITKIDQEGQRTVVNETPAVPKEELMDAIVSKYRGKVVVVDFWATWCGPCMDAMRSTLDVKSAMHGKDVVFVYVTDVTSPQERWTKEIQAIRGEHYYLTKEEWNYLLDQFDFESIPTYLFFDKEGALKRNQTSFMGAETMKEWIDELL